MNTIKGKIIPLSLTVRFGDCQRDIETDGALSRRAIKLRCSVLSNSLKGEDQPGRGDEIKLWFHEADAGEGFGSFDTLGFIQLGLPPATFTEFWRASAAADGAARDLYIQFKKDDSFEYKDNYIITKVQLTEHMPEPIDFDPKAHAPGYIPGRVHPVVVELRDMRRELIASWRQALFMALLFWVAFALWSGPISSALRALWGLISG
jgi:hypothetical protein